MILKDKDFKEHPCGLFVASDGEIYVPSGSRGVKEHFTFGTVNTHGYLQVGRNGKIYKVHRLVAECFLPNENNLLEVDHIDRNKTNNDISNLRWADRSMQCYNRGKFTKPNTPKNNAKSKKVLQLTLDGKLLKEWPSTAECHRNGFNHGAVAACCNGILPHYKKFLWRYEKNEED